MKNKGIAIVLALFMGGLGVHRFYVGRVGSGFLYLIFFWTFIPAILGLIEAIHWALMSDADFQKRYA
jgi:TM2 domain-containing membrane protein YozV